MGYFKDLIEYYESLLSEKHSLLTDKIETIYSLKRV